MQFLVGVQTVGSAAVLLLAAMAVLSRTPRTSATVYAWAALPQVVVLLALAAGSGQPWPLLVDAAAVGVIKGLWAPRLLARAVPRSAEVYGHAVRRAPPVLMSGAAAVTLLGLELGARLASSRAGHLPLGLALAAMFVGFGTAAVRSELWSQAVGILMGEAGLFMSLVIWVSGLPPLGEMAALAEVAVLAALLGALSQLVQATYGRQDARLLQRLRG